mmetsp:Transcript_25281/g.80366  ORF Transcript_25281/g.80366 Transcript_25281/m.80366 type:complete len:216 (-) Transcript_25281:1265-1912(-)
MLFGTRFLLHASTAARGTLLGARGPIRTGAPPALAREPSLAAMPATAPCATSLPARVWHSNKSNNDKKNVGRRTANRYQASTWQRLMSGSCPLAWRCPTAQARRSVPARRQSRAGASRAGRAVLRAPHATAVARARAWLAPPLATARVVRHFCGRSACSLFSSFARAWVAVLGTGRALAHFRSAAARPTSGHARARNRDHLLHPITRGDHDLLQA